jgi:hypothetical protein
MNSSETAITAILISVARRQVTLDQLKTKLSEGLAYVESVGAKNVDPSLIEALSLLDSAIARIEASRAKIEKRFRN